MIRLGRQLIIKLGYILIDVAFLSMAIYLACLLREKTLPFDVTLANLVSDTANPFRNIFLVWILLSIIINHGNGLYQTKREIYEATEIWQIIKSVCLSSLIIIVTIYVVKVEGFPRTVTFLVALFMAVFFSLWRVFKRLFVQYLVSQGYNNTNALIVGAGKVGTALAEEIKRKPELGIRVVGFLDDFKKEPLVKAVPPVLGKLDDFVRVCRQEFVSIVFITIHHDSSVFLQLLKEAKDMSLAVRVVPQGFDLMPNEFCKYNIGLIPILEYCEFVDVRKQAGKRLFDFVASLTAFLLLLPVFIVISVLIKLDSPGPVFYFSRRYGYKGKIFNMYKFRSMVQAADQQIDKIKDKNEVDGPIFKMRRDPRITRVGSFLRKYSLDELPQLINVICGDMSLVGPRPFPIHQVEREDLRQLHRLEVRPGITGLWQIRGRSDISFSRLLKWDVWYINNWSFWLDVNILLQTIPVVIKAKGAY